MKTRYLFVSVLMLLAIVLSSCQPAATPTAAPAADATTAPAAAEDPCATDAFGCAKLAAGTTIKIGMGAPMTGDNAQFGIDISQGAMVAVTDGGDIEGWKFELVAQDDGGTPEGGAAVANKLVSDPSVVAVAGHIFSGATNSAMPIYEKVGIPMMSPSATNPALTTKGSKVFNRVAFTDSAQGKFAAEYLYNTLGFKKIAVMHDGQSYGQGLAEVVTETFVGLGGEVVATEAITPGETDYSAPLSALAAKSPQAVYYGGYVQEAVVLMNQWAQSGLQGVVFFGCDGTYGQDFIDRTAANGEGAYAVALVPAASDAVNKFNDTYLAEFGKVAGSLSPFTWNAYDSTATLIAAIKSVAFKGSDGSLYIPRGALVDAVRGTKDFQGLSGTLSCDAVGECNASGPIFYIVKDGKWAPAGSTASEPAAEPAAAEDPCATDAFGCAKLAAGTTIKIGMGAPMTGDNAQFGIDISQGAMVAVTDGGDIEGWKFELVAQDDGGTPEGGAAVANKLVSDPSVVAVAGHIFSGATDSAMPIYEKVGIPMMSPSATNPALTTTGSKVFNRVAFTDSAQGKFAAEYLYNTLGFKKIAVMHDGQSYGQGLAEVVTKTFVGLGGEVVATEAITPGETDYSAPLSALAAKSPQAVYYGGYVQEAVVLVNQWAQSGLQDVVFFGCDGTYGQDFIDRTAANGEGAYAVALVPAASDAVNKFNDTYLAEFGKVAGSLSPFTWNAYDSTATLIAAIKSVAFKGSDGSLYIPRGALVDAVRGTKDFQGLSGTLSCDTVGECNASGPIFYIVKDGKWAPAEK